MSEYEWAVAGTYVTGLSHIQKNIGCHDRFAYKRKNDVISISLADGAGSVMYPEIGAEIATSQINKMVTEKFDLLFNAEASAARHKITHSIRTSIGIHAKEKSVNKKEFATTLMFVGVKGDRFIAGHIGDGVIGYLKNKQLKSLSLPENGEFVNETHFITSNSYKSRFRLFKGNLGSISGFVLMTDGTCESFFEKKSNAIAPVILTIFEWLDSFSSDEVNSALYENFENLVKNNTTDDCGIGLMKLVISK